jgi:hypothetical protein
VVDPNNTNLSSLLWRHFRFWHRYFSSVVFMFMDTSPTHNLDTPAWYMKLNKGIIKLYLCSSELRAIVNLIYLHVNWEQTHIFLQRPICFCLVFLWCLKDKINKQTVYSYTRHDYTYIIFFLILLMHTSNPFGF